MLTRNYENYRKILIRGIRNEPARALCAAGEFERMRLASKKRFLMQYRPAYFLALSLLLISPLRSEPLGLVLPTDNDAIFSDPSKFYMYTDRNFEGDRKSVV